MDRWLWHAAAPLGFEEPVALEVTLVDAVGGSRQSSVRWCPPSRPPRSAWTAALLRFLLPHGRRACRGGFTEQGKMLLSQGLRRNSPRLSASMFLGSSKSKPKAKETQRSELSPAKAASLRDAPSIPSNGKCMP